jgi:hypothetical protein
VAKAVSGQTIQEWLERGMRSVPGALAMGLVRRRLRLPSTPEACVPRAHRYRSGY